MKKIKSKETKPEIVLRKKLWRLGLRYRKNYGKLKGTPDIVFLKKKVVVFVDGEFWHGYNWGEKKQKIKSNKEYWIAKIERNIKRDKSIDEYFASEGWIVLRFWEKEIRSNLKDCVGIILKELQKPNN
jgi:DNA mismatch endonuclease (patch repair protein)